jgi:hypothetical protein
VDRGLVAIRGGKDVSLFSTMYLRSLIGLTPSGVELADRLITEIVPGVKAAAGKDAGGIGQLAAMHPG